MSDITISRVVPGISSIQFHILEFFCVLVLLPQHSGVLDKLTGGHLVPCVQVFTDEYVALRKSSDGGEADVQFCLELRDLGCSRSFLAHNLVCDQVCLELFI